MSAAATARVTLTRTSAADVGQRQVVVRVDDQAGANLLFGETITRDLAPGEHVLRVHNTLVWKKVPFRVTAGEQVEFLIVNRPGRFTLGFLSLMGVAPLFLSIERRPPAGG